MEMYRPLLSVCIPTYNRLEILEKTIHSIYQNIDNVNFHDFEIIVADNEPNQSSKKIVEKFNYPNLYYYHTTCEGFKNSFEVLKLGTGEFLKLHNNSNLFKTNTLKELIDEISENKTNRPLIFHSNGLFKRKGITAFYSFNHFMYSLSYLSSWSTGFGIWKDDFDKIKNITLIDPYFPQLSLLLSNENKETYFINNKIIFDFQVAQKKGGYNIFKVFGVDYLNLIQKAVDRQIDLKTYKKIKTDLLYKFLNVQYIKTVILKKEFFDYSDLKEHLKIHFKFYEYYLMILSCVFIPFKKIIKNSFNK